LPQKVRQFSWFVKRTTLFSSHIQTAFLPHLYYRIAPPLLLMTATVIPSILADAMWFSYSSYLPVVFCRPCSGLWSCLFLFRTFPLNAVCFSTNSKAYRQFVKVSAIEFRGSPRLFYLKDCPTEGDGVKPTYSPPHVLIKAIVATMGVPIAVLFAWVEKQKEPRT